MLRKVRNKPDSAKRRIAFTLAFSLTLLIAGVWATALRLTPGEKDVEASVGSSPLAELAEDISMIFEETPSMSEVVGEKKTPIREEVPEKEIYFDPDRDPEEFDGTVYVDHPRFHKETNE